MLELKNISKIYKMDVVEQKALDKVSIAFRKNEFVSILGQSGSGKSTMLNIIGGLDHYTSGDLLIGGISTKRYKDSDWDAYRNHKIGFIFQNYNLIMHQTVLSNVELALTLSGVSPQERKNKAKEALTKVGLGNHLNKKPSQLSGGQMQRVAIARALVNDPEIILADEPTGALDSETSIQIMDLLKEVAKEKLVIMVTHNPELAKAYSTRIVELKDGKIISDTKPFDGKEEEENVDNKNRKSMSLLTALSLSKNNLLTKKGRTILTAIAGSVGIVGIALVLSLSNGVNHYINDLQTSSFASQPISVKNTIVEEAKSDEINFEVKKKKDHKNKILANDDISNNVSLSQKTRTKKVSLKNLKEYIESNEKEVSKIASDVVYVYDVDIQLYDKNANGDLVKVNPTEDAEDVGTDLLSSLLSTSILKNSFVELKNAGQYEVVSGTMPTNKNEVVLVVNEDNEISLSTMYSLNIENKEDIYKFLEKSENGEKVKLKDVSYDYNKIIGKTYKLINATDYYSKNGNVWVSNENNSSYMNKLYNKAESIKIVGIVKAKDNNSVSGFLGYSHGLVEEYVKKASKSQIVKEQISNKKINVFTGRAFEVTKESYDANLKVLGAATLDDPKEIDMYPKTADSKKDIKKFLDNYNSKASKNEKVKYEDNMEALTGILSTVVSIISFVMIAFVSISLIVSSIMIAIITYISVLARTKEIGILRAIGASKKDVRRVFRAETIIEGLFAGILGIAISFLLSVVVNGVVKLLADIDNIMSLSIGHSIILILISVGLTVVAGLLPANMASKKDPVESLKTE